MYSSSFHRVFANASDGFSLKLFENKGFTDLCYQALDDTGRWHQRDCPLKAPLVMWFVVMMTLRRHLSIPNILRNITHMLRATAPGLSLRAVTGEAVCMARARLGFEPMKVLFESISQKFDPAPSFKELRVWAVDGVDLTMPDTPANESRFGRPGGSRGPGAFPQMKMITLVDTVSHQVKYASTGDYKSPERPPAKKFLRYLGRDDLVLMDIGFAAAWVFERQDNDAHFLCRISSSWKPKIVDRIGPGDFLVEVSGRVQLSPEDQERLNRKTRFVVLQLRMIKYEIKGHGVIRVLTSLTDPDRYPARELAVLYHQRWESELSNDELKTHLQTVTHGTPHTIFRSKRPDGVLQEAWGMLVGYNLIRETMAEAGQKHDIPPLEISFVDSLEVIRLAIPRFQAAAAGDLDALTDQILRDIAECRIDRPRRNRAYPRKVKRKMSNYGVKRPEHRQENRDFEQELALTDAEPKRNKKNGTKTPPVGQQSGSTNKLISRFVRGLSAIAATLMGRALGRNLRATPD